MITIQNTHYQPIRPLRYPGLSLKNAMCLEELLFELGANSVEKPLEPRCLIDHQETQLDTWAVVEFSDSLHLFPTARSEDIGAIVSYMGKTYYVWFDEDFKLNIGINGKIYCFNNDSFVEDFYDIYHTVFLGLNPDEDSPQPY